MATVNRMASIYQRMDRCPVTLSTNSGQGAARSGETGWETPKQLHRAADRPEVSRPTLAVRFTAHEQQRLRGSPL